VLTEAITIEQLERLVEQVEADALAERNRLCRLIGAYARIIWIREPERFKRQPLEFGDEDGHYDNSYPPSLVYKDFSGPRLLEVVRCDWDTVAMSGGFYHTWRVASPEPGLYVTPRGEIWGATAAGTGRYGQFAAYPGNYDVRVVLTWHPLGDEDVSLSDLRIVEKVLRGMAFPRAVQRQT